MLTSHNIEIALLWAASPRGLIGRDDWMPWRLPDDLRNFRRLTVGSCVLMGHRTYRCIGKPLPDRDNLVMRRQIDGPMPGVHPVQSLDAALERCAQLGHSRLWVVGGAQIYKLALHRADRLEMTLVDDPQELQAGDTLFPFRPDAQWRLQQARFHSQDARHTHAFSFLSYRRIRSQPTPGSHASPRPL